MERTPALEQLIALARATALNISLRGYRATLEDVRPLEELVALFSPAAVGLSQYAHAYISPPPRSPGDVRYLHIAQERDFSIGIFVLPPGSYIPLHDHPNMCVVSHVLYGSVKITSYDRVEGEGGGSSHRRSSSEEGQPAILRASGWHHAPYTTRLSPEVANLHELEAGSEGTAILDILIPPYDDDVGRECTYFRAEQTAEDQVRLVLCSPGQDFRVARGEFVNPFPTSMRGRGDGVWAWVQAARKDHTAKRQKTVEGISSRPPKSVMSSATYVVRPEVVSGGT